MPYSHDSSRSQDAPGLIEQRLPVMNTAQDMHEQHNVKSAIMKRKLASISLNQKTKTGAGLKFTQHGKRCIHSNIGVAGCNESSADSSCASANIKHAHRCRNMRGSKDHRANGLWNSAG